MQVIEKPVPGQRLDGDLVVACREVNGQLQFLWWGRWHEMDSLSPSPPSPVVQEERDPDPLQDWQIEWIVDHCRWLVAEGDPVMMESLDPMSKAEKQQVWDAIRDPELKRGLAALAERRRKMEGSL